VDSNTRVRLDGQPSSVGALKDGDHIFTLQVDGAAARFVLAFDRPPGSPSAAGA